MPIGVSGQRSTNAAEKRNHQGRAQQPQPHQETPSQPEKARTIPKILPSILSFIVRQSSKAGACSGLLLHQGWIQLSGAPLGYSLDRARSRWSTAAAEAESTGMRRWLTVILLPTK